MLKKNVNVKFLLRIFVSETYSIQDIKYYDPLTSNKGHWTIPSGANVSFGSTGMVCGSGSWNDFYLEIPITKPCEIEYDIVSWTGTNSYQLYLWDSTKANREFHLYRSADGGGRTIFDNYPSYGNYWSSSLPQSCTVKIKVLSNSLELYVDGDYKISKSYSMSSPLVIGFLSASNRTTTYKNLKIKAL